MTRGGTHDCIAGGRPQHCVCRVWAVLSEACVCAIINHGLWRGMWGMSQLWIEQSYLSCSIPPPPIEANGFWLHTPPPLMPTTVRRPAS
jgi:hypothetical protein